ncbi:MAG: L,D-transpeptidase family protein [Pseudomonadota bacterium]|nr:L,D-transpeptidase family protein [Pseudomonadota bacterium]
MKTLWSLLTVGAALALASCTTAPPPKPVAVTVKAAPPAPSMAPYRWTHGHAPKAYQAMVASFGRTGFKPGEYVWAPSIPKEGDTRVVVDLLTQMAYVYRADQLIGATTISSGKKGKETPLGFWSVLQKKKSHFSRKYDDAPMPFMQRLDEFGIAFHAGKTPGYPASHGCIRMPPKFAEKLYGLTKLGTKVVIEG